MVWLVRLVVWLALACPALAQTPALDLLLSGSGVHWAAPPLNAYAIGYGDSRTANAGGISFASSTLTSAIVPGNNDWAAWLFPQSGNGAAGAATGNGNRYISEYWWNYGVGAQTTAGIAGRLNSAAFDCNASNCLSTAPTYTGRNLNIGTTCTPGGSCTAVSGNVPAGATSIDIIALSGGAPQNGDYISVNGYTIYNCKLSGVALVSGSSTIYSATIPSTCITNTITTATTVWDSPAAKSSNFAAFLGASGAGTTVTDMNNNILTNAQYAPTSDPATVAFVLAGTNDGGLTNTTAQPQTQVNLAAIVNGLRTGSAVKTVVLANERPSGLATGCSAAGASGGLCVASGVGNNGSPEIHTIPTSSPYNITLNIPAAYFDTIQVFYAPCGSVTTAGSGLNKQGTGSGVTGDSYNCTGGTPTGTYTAPSGDGTNVINCTSGVTAAPNGAATCTPSTGQYSVTTGGVYTFNAADAGKKVAIWYRWTSNATGLQHKVVHDWVTSTSCAPFTGAMSGIVLPAGAGCKKVYPNVSVADTWSQIVDTTVPGYNATTGPFYPKPYTEVDGLHDLGLGGELTTQAMLTAASSAGVVPAAAAYTPPAVAGIKASASYYNTGTVAYGTGSCAANPYYTTNKSQWIVSLSPATNVANPNTGALLYGPAGTQSSPYPVFSASAGLSTSPQTHVVCVDTVNNALLLDQAATAINATTIYALVDGVNTLTGGVFDHTNFDVTTPLVACKPASTMLCGLPVGTGFTFTAGVPDYPSNGWGAPTFDGGTPTAIQNGTLGFAYGMATNPFGDGADYEVVQLSGYAGATALSTFTLTQGIVSTYQLASIPSGATMRGICSVRVGPGPNGHLYGFTGVSVGASLHFTSATPSFWPTNSAGNTFPITFWAGSYSASLQHWSDGMVKSGAPNTDASNRVSLAELSPPAISLGSSPSAATLTVAVNWAGNDPVSATVYIGRCSLFTAAQ